MNDKGRQDSSYSAKLRIVGISYRKLADYKKALNYYEMSLETLERDLETSTPEKNYEAINAMKNASYSGYQLLENLLE